MLSGDFNLPPIQDEESQGKGKREREKRRMGEEGRREGGSGGERMERGGAVPSSGAEKCLDNEGFSLLFH